MSRYKNNKPMYIVSTIQTAETLDFLLGSSTVPNYENIVVEHNFPITSWLDAIQSVIETHNFVLLTDDAEEWFRTVVAGKIIEDQAKRAIEAAELKLEDAAIVWLNPDETEVERFVFNKNLATSVGSITINKYIEEHGRRAAHEHFMLMTDENKGDFDNV